jgi:hypothetical protein
LLPEDEAEAPGVVVTQAAGKVVEAHVPLAPSADPRLLLVLEPDERLTPRGLADEAEW